MGTDIHGVFQKKTDAGWEVVPTNYDFSRHYALFAWLGNVRNGFGFAGVPTHSEITPLSDGRGFPEDFTEPEEPWMGDHSFSWLSAGEILSATPPKIRRTGVVSIGFFKQWDGVSAPTEFCGGICGPRVVVSTPETITDATTDVQISWDVDTAEHFAYFIDEVRQLKEEHGEVRFVFGFDS